MNSFLCKSCEKDPSCLMMTVGPYCKEYVPVMTIRRTGSPIGIDETGALKLMELLLQFIPGCRLGEPLVQPYEWTDGFYGSYKQYPGVNMPQKCQSCEHSYHDRCFIDAPVVDDKINWDNVRDINLEHPCLRYSPKTEMLPCDW